MQQENLSANTADRLSLHTTLNFRNMEGSVAGQEDEREIEPLLTQLLPLLSRYYW
jgi:hypothetical protein